MVLMAAWVYLCKCVGDKVKDSDPKVKQAACYFIGSIGPSISFILLGTPVIVCSRFWPVINLVVATI